MKDGIEIQGNIDINEFLQECAEFTKWVEELKHEVSNLRGPDESIIKPQR